MKPYLTITLLGIALSLHAQTTRLSLQQCIGLALAQNDKVQAAAKSVQRAKTLQATAWDVDKTELSLSQDPTSGGSPDNAVSLSQTIDFPTLYVARHRQLKAETQAEYSRLNLVKKEVTAEVTAAYCQWQYEQRRLSLLNQQDTLLTRFLQMAEKRHEAGEARQLEVLSAERMQRENRLEIAIAKSETEQARLLLAQLVKTPDIEPADTQLEPLPFTLPSYDYSQTASGLYAADRLTVADRAVSVAKNGYAPTLSLSLRHQAVLTGWDPYHQQRSRFDGGNFMGFEVGVGVPLFFGATKAKVKAARQERDILQHEMRAEQLRQTTEYQSLLSRINAAHSRIEYYRESGTAKANEMTRLATLEYEQGEITYIEYTNVLQESVSIRQKEASAIHEYNQAVIELQKTME